MYAIERHFVTTAKAQLRLLARSLNQNSNKGLNNKIQTEASLHTDIKKSIHTIKLASGPAKARAIYRTALLCEDILNRYPTSSPKFHISLASLKSLIDLYTDGLLEIDPSFKSVLLDSTAHDNIIGGQTQKPEQDIGETKTQDRNQDIQQDEVLTESITANENAAHTLKPLLKLVRNNEQLEALSFLTRQVQENTPSSQRESSAQANIRFEASMRQITNRTLGQARAVGKDISISYAADFDVIEKKTALELQAFLESACLEVLRTGLPNPEINRKRTWQISLTGSHQTQGLGIAITWPGKPVSEALRETSNQTLPNDQNFHRASKRFQALGGTLQSKTKKQADRDNVNGLDTGLDIQTLEIIFPATETRKLALDNLATDTLRQKLPQNIGAAHNQPALARNTQREA